LFRQEICIFRIGFVKFQTEEKDFGATFVNLQTLLQNLFAPLNFLQNLCQKLFAICQKFFSSKLPLAISQ